jgi:hypothetical protein
MCHTAAAACCADGGFSGATDGASGVLGGGTFRCYDAIGANAIGASGCANTGTGWDVSTQDNGHQ